jgi:hypothetical protein
VEYEYADEYADVWRDLLAALQLLPPPKLLVLLVYEAY